jgi:glycosyl-4,4'-diaponeurosporenoate acyltransferase
MQLIHIPWPVMIASFFVFWLLYQSLVPLLCLRIDLKALDYRKGIYKARRWEGRGFYARYFKVAAWKKYLPDGGAVSKKGFRKKRLMSTDPAYLELFLAESCRAELTHWLCIFPFWIFGFWAPPAVIPMMFAYSLAVNLPCIIAQRYNRPRIAALLEKKRGFHPGG